MFVYLDLMAQSLGFKIADAATDVFNAKSAEIGYPKPGMWHCPECGYELEQVSLNPKTMAVTARDEPGPKCPNCKTPLWRGPKLIEARTRYCE